ncbi:extracellular solute-binding protein [Alphaproteobacteria bacterium GH1-50]|uniref:Extracellular solute-binding protein n=1 Tax=Kangsaoukella pontilimi TaxID=2691042 RepID=A0A7C9IHQ0_9RHOB|nr:extracellular solute-binding protein [Kangsaoukella pontilimi]MXQ09228.1 extracellular solute-binding protein [Kangsaoukella pontilimi]
MRHACLSLVLSLWAAVALAFEIEADLTYPAEVETGVLTILSTADREAFEPILLAFQADNPGVTIRYTIASTAEAMKAVADEGARFDLVISSAMDLQTKLANDGFAATYRSAATDALPDWARWRNQLFAFTQEPVVLIVSDDAFPDGEVPATRNALIEVLRDQPERFRGKIGTYDVRESGFGYLLATQDARASENSWRLLEIMGRLDTRLYCCSGDMLRDIRSGDLLLAYNVLGSYAAAQQAEAGGFRIVEMEDFSNIMLRTVMILNGAENREESAAMVDFLARLGGRPDLVRASGLPAIDDAALRDNVALRPIRLGPGLLVFLDRLKRRTFLRNWEASITQE